MKYNKSLQTDGVMPALFRYRFLITVFLLAVVLFVGGASATTYEADTTANFTTNLSAAENGDTILITGDFTVSNVTIDKEITIQSDASHTLTASSDRLFYINATGNLTLGDGVTLTGGSTDYGGAVYVNNGGNFTMSGNSTITNNTAAYNGGGVYVNESGTFNMNGGTISNNTAKWGGGVLLYSGTFNMNGGTITNNTATNGGGVFVNGGTFTMTGGTISNNTATYDGGGVYVLNGTFTMNGGTITNNTATSGDGGAVYVNNSTFNMTGGTISDNTARNGGGVFTAGTFNMNGGNIAGNNADSGGGVLLYSGTFNMTGGTISDNNASWKGGGVEMSGGTFNMTGSAIVNINNDVYLYSGQFITVTGDLDPSAGARNITPAFTGIGDKVVEYGSVDIHNWSSNFALNTTWIQVNQMDLAQSETNLSLSNNFTVKYYLTDSDTNPHDTLTNITYDAALTPPAAPTRTGYTFSSWNQGSSSGIPWNFTTDTVKANTNLYANWTANPTPTPITVPTDSGDGGNDGNNADSGLVSPDGTFTTNDGGLVLHYPAGSNIIVTVFKDYFNGAAAPSNVSYLTVYDVHSTAVTGTSITLMFRVNASILEEKNVTSNDIAILHYYDGEWHQMTIKSIELVDGVYQFTVTSTHTSPFMVAYNVDGSWFPLEEASTPTSTQTTSPKETVPTSTTPTQTETPSSPVPLVGIIAGLGAAGLLLRRR